MKFFIWLKNKCFPTFFNFFVFQRIKNRKKTHFLNHLTLCCGATVGNPCFESIYQANSRNFDLSAKKALNFIPNWVFPNLVRLHLTTSSSSHFHQHFTSSLYANFLSQKNTNLSRKYKKSCSKDFCTKKLHVKTKLKLTRVLNALQPPKNCASSLNLHFSFSSIDVPAL